MKKYTFHDLALKTGDLVLFRTPLSWSPMSWLAQLIRIFTGSAYNHAGIIVEIWGRPFLLEANERGLVAAPAEYRLHGREILVRKPLFSFISSEIARRAVSRLGVSKYDFKSLFVYQVLYQIFGTWKGKKNDDAVDRLYCSEFYAWCFREEFVAWYLTDPEVLVNTPLLADKYRLKL